MGNCDNDFHITKTLPGAANEILKRSYALYEVPETTGDKIQTAHREAVRFFNCECDDSGAALRKYQKIIDGHLYGFNEPSPAKQVFRAFVHSPHQPWPTSSKSDGSNVFRQSSMDLVDDLHKMLVECYDHIISSSSLCRMTKNRQTCCLSQQEEQQHGDGDERQDDVSFGPTPSKRTCIATRVDQDFENGIEYLAMSQLPPQSPHPLPPLPSDPYWCSSSTCPLDYFFYHNRCSPSMFVPNCTEHVDRGLLIVVCLTNVPGLEVLDRRCLMQKQQQQRRDGSKKGTDGEDCFVCPEVLFHKYNAHHEVNESKRNLVCIMAGDQLRSHLGGNPPACVHRVRDNLKRARLSISYELR
jgi:hypothetical protein